MMGHSLPNRQLLGSVRFQEADQEIADMAGVIVQFLGQGPGQVVDTAATDDDTRILLIVGYDVGRCCTKVSVP